MALDATQKMTFRKVWAYDLYDDSASPPIALCDYNAVFRSSFYSDADLDAIYDQVIMENPRLFQAYDGEGPIAVDVTTGVYRAMRAKCWQQMLVSSRFVKAIYQAGSSDDVVRTIIANMQDAIKNDATYKAGNGPFPRSIVLQRA